MREHTTLPCEKIPAASNTYDSSRVKIDTIVCHTTVGTKEGTIAWFRNSQRGSHSSAHYIIGYNDGSIVNMVSEANTAYHAGNYPVNQRSIGIEFVDNGEPDQPRPDILYQTGSKLIADICNHYQIPLDRSHVVLHREVSQKPTACPGTLDVDRLIEGALNPQQTPDPVREYKMTESVFLGMVKKARNFDDVADHIKLSQEARLDPKAGEEVVNYIKQIQKESKRLIEYSNRLLEQMKGQSTPPEENSGPLEKFLPPKQPETPSSEGLDLLGATQAEIDTIERGKELLYRDAQNVFKKILSYFWT